MLIVRVELHSAVTGKITEIARMRITNSGNGDTTRDFYNGVSLRGRDTKQLDRGQISKPGAVSDYPRQSLHVWNLVRRMLVSMGYTK